MSTVDITASRRQLRYIHGPGPFDAGSEFRYDPSRLRHPHEEERPEPVDDSLEPAPFVPAEPVRAVRRLRWRSLTRQPRVRVRSLAGFALVATLATGAASILGGLSLGPLDHPTGSRHAAAGLAALPADEQASSQAITSESGPFHPVRTDAPIDYGDSGAMFGADRGGRAHEGQDMFAESGSPLIAVRDGTVIETGNDGGRGNYVGIYSPAEDHTYVYLHMLSPTPLKPGEQVGTGTEVGAMGCTGSCYGTHLHFEVRIGKGVDRKPVDPLPIVRQWPQAP